MTTTTFTSNQTLICPQPVVIEGVVGVGGGGGDPHAPLGRFFGIGEAGVRPDPLSTDPRRPTLGNEFKTRQKIEIIADYFANSCLLVCGQIWM